ncbi:peptidylprolyl isomerase [Paradesulfitobacterium ferrireducens]|uniref:peptidylprolyl isomerase n=1 Tax=Paradesulfitobacterium ferrireducens TaxID=2816476 RepID=UPI001A8F8602|nr:peptidylprolyl isomerase [Paradesulfitobacterium ferrireducens]
MKKPLVGILTGLLAFSFILTGCSSLVGGKWVAKVNGEQISQTDYDARVALMQKTVEDNSGSKLTADQQKQLKDAVLQSMIGSKIIEQEIKKLNVDVNSSKVTEQVEKDKQDAGGEDKLKQLLAFQYLATLDDYRNQIALAQKLTDDVQVSDAEVKAYFEANPQNYGGQAEQVKAKNIVVATEDEAKQIISQLKAVMNSGQLATTFEQLAKEKSTDPTAKDNGGELGYFSKGDMVPEFSNAAFAQKVGTVSEAPVKSTYGYHVILVEDHKNAVPGDFNKYKDQIKQDALTDAKGKKLQSYYDQIHGNAKIEYSSAFKPQG